MKAILMFVALAAMTLAGCTSDKPEFETPAQDAEGRYIIEMHNSLRFTPNKAEVPAGSTVIFVNKGGIHDTEADNGAWKSPPNMKDGDTFEVTLEEAGDYTYRCNPHVGNGMVGTIRVV